VAARQENQNSFSNAAVSAFRPAGGSSPGATLLTTELPC